jgi:hypothetical protein
VAQLCHEVLLDCWGASDKFVFEVKRLPNGKTDLKTVKSKAQTQRKINAAAQKHASASIA